MYRDNLAHVDKSLMKLRAAPTFLPFTSTSHILQSEMAFFSSLVLVPLTV